MDRVVLHESLLFTTVTEPQRKMNSSLWPCGSEQPSLPSAALINPRDALGFRFAPPQPTRSARDQRRRGLALGRGHALPAARALMYACTSSASNPSSFCSMACVAAFASAMNRVRLPATSFSSTVRWGVVVLCRFAVANGLFSRLSPSFVDRIGLLGDSLSPERALPGLHPGYRAVHLVSERADSTTFSMNLTPRAPSSTRG
jgi:hypothetical protein